MEMQKEILYTTGEVVKEMRNAGFKSFHTHNLKSLEKIMQDTFEIRTDEHLNRVYDNEDVKKIKMILRLKEKGFSYAMIKTILHSTETEEEIACTNTDLQIQEKEILLSDGTFDKFKSVVTEIVRESVDETISPHLVHLRQEIISLKEQNETLKDVLEKQQEEHFKQIDYKISKWRAEQAFRREKKPWYKKIFS